MKLLRDLTKNFGELILSDSIIEYFFKLFLIELFFQNTFSYAVFYNIIQKVISIN